jgi:hypothetical protein
MMDSDHSQFDWPVHGTCSHHQLARQLVSIVSRYTELAACPDRSVLLLPLDQGSGHQSLTLRHVYHLHQQKNLLLRGHQLQKRDITYISMADSTERPHVHAW